MARKMVIVKDFRGRYLERVAWEATDDKVYVTDVAGYDELLMGLGVPPVGFPRTDVYEYDAELHAALLGGVDVRGRLKLWRG